VCRRPLRVDAVEKVGHQSGVRVDHSFDCASCELIRLLFSPAAGFGSPTDRRDAGHAQAGCGDGRMCLKASIFKFCTLAARWNSSRRL
jgi:hypothetical protein